MEPFDTMRVPLEGRVLVEASAGTGKTHAITTLFLRLLLERGLEINRILVVTFTEAATAELRVRLRARLAAALSAFAGHDSDRELALLRANTTDQRLALARLRFALENVDSAAVHTIHGFCQRVLKDCAFESGTELDAELVTDLSLLRDEVLCDYWTRELALASRATVMSLRRARLWPVHSQGLADRVSRDPHMLVLPEHVTAEDPSTEPFREAFQRMKARWDRVRIERELVESQALHRGKYKRSQLPELCDAMDAYVAAGPPELPRVFEGFELLRATTLAASCNKGHQPPSGPLYTACDWLARTVEEYERAAKTRVLAFRRGLVDWVRSELPRRKAEAGIMAFDDLLLRLHAALDERLVDAVRRRFPAALVDEFQDTDPIQYDIFDRIWKRDALFLIGDPKQAIYAFRGADVFAYLRASRAVAEGRRFTMGVNWRSDPGLVSAIQATMRAPRSPFLLEAIELPEVQPNPGAEDRMAGPALRVLFARRDGNKKTIAKQHAREHLPHVIAADVSSLLRSRSPIGERVVGPGDIAVLTRTNEQAFHVQAALGRLGVRGVVLGDQSVFEDQHPDARELEQLLRAVAEPTRTQLVRAALTTTLCGLRADDLARMEADGSWDEWVARFRRWHERWVKRGFVQMFRAFLAEAQVFERLLALPEGERRVTNLLHLMELLHGAQSTLHLGPTGLAGWLRQQQENARARPEAAQIRLESDERAVKITTVHKSKGLEYPVVYVPYAWDGRLLSQEDDNELLFHDDDDVVKLTLAPDPAHRERAKGEKLAESIRLLYVALTRARHRCTVVWGGFKDFDTSALGYVLHPPVLALREPSVEDASSHLVNLNDERMLRDLASLQAEQPGAIDVREIDLQARGDNVPSDDSQPARTLEARAMRRPIVSWWRTASFTALASGVDSGEGRDRDEHAVTPSPAPDDRAIDLLAFPRGARAGNFFHEIFEEIDFDEPLSDRSRTMQRVEDKLDAYHYPREHGEAVVQRLAAVVATPLSPAGKRRLRLCDVRTNERKNELEFHLPVGAAGTRRVLPHGTQLELGFSTLGREPGRLDAGRLAYLFADHPSPELDAGYAERVARLGFLPLEGFVKGYIDLVFARHGRFFLVDYKTNHLGDTLGSYACERLPEAMAKSHYYLQYHLYAVALHRHLERRVSGYRYEEHFGGVYYLFIKGMTPERGAQSGVFYERPPRARIDALSELLHHPGGGRT